MSICSNCGAPAPAESSNKISFKCDYCGSFNLLGERKAPSYNDNSLQELIDTTVRHLNSIKEGQRDCYGTSWYKRLGSIADDYVDYLSDWIYASQDRGKKEREIPMCTVSDTFIKAIGYYEFLRVVIILFRSYDVNETEYDNNLARDWVKNAKKGKSVGSFWRKLGAHYKVLMKKVGYSQYRGLSDDETFKILTTISTIATEYLDRIHINLFGALRNAIDNSSFGTDSVWRMAGIELNNRLYFISLLIPASNLSTVGTTETNELKNIAKKIACDSVLLTSINHIGYNELKYTISGFITTYTTTGYEKDPQDKRILSFLDELDVSIPTPEYNEEKIKKPKSKRKKPFLARVVFWVIIITTVWILIGSGQYLWAAIIGIFAWLLWIAL